MRRIGVENGLKLNEYGLFERESGTMVAGATEEEVYEALGLRYVEPEIRENSGELEASKQGTLPVLVNRADIRGDFHVHTSWSDGANKVEDVVSTAVAKGYEYIAITDHSQSLRIANGLSPERLGKQIDAVRKADELGGGRVRVLAGSEVDIRADGSLDFPSSLLKNLDIVIGSVHSRFKMEKNEMTERVVNAVSSGQIDILGHPTGRLIGKRAPYALDLEKVFSAARDSGVCMELNSFPDRLDLADANCRHAMNSGVKVAIATDAHSVEQMDYIKYGITTARRGWLEAKDVLNTVRGKDILKRLHGGRP